MPRKERRLIYEKQYYLLNKEKFAHNQRKRLYGISKEETNLLLQQQNNLCLICSADISNYFHVDHCHTTNKIRGLLCRRCNTGLGYYEKYKTQFEEYLKLYGTR